MESAAVTRGSSANPALTISTLCALGAYCAEI
jgi:hypothetical protein